VSGADYSNLLEQQFHRLPGFLQGLLRDPFNWIDDVVRDIAGQPEELLNAGAGYAALGRQISQLGAEQYQDRTAILAKAWQGQAYEAFSAQMTGIEQRIETLATATAQTQPLLEAAAQACTQSADVIVEIVEGTISFIIQDAVISGLASLFTFGAAAAAGAAAAVAEFATACDEVGGVVARLAALLEKVAALLAKIDEICTEAALYLKKLQVALKEAKGFQKLLPKLQRTGINMGVRAAAGTALDGKPFPGPAGGAYGAARSAYRGYQDAQQAQSGA
jgi:uncharacterized protein YukE